uniref:Uncharacterized protein n=1 Tax=Anopheles dirus TaxID=7168 RepID=A0A182N9T2_9DIPT
MQTEAILLTLVGLISTALTSPLVAKPPPRIETPNVPATESNASNTSQTAAEAQIQHLQTYCSGLAQDAGCLAYKEMLSVAQEYKLTDVENTIAKELTRKMSNTEVDEFCVELSRTVQNLPPSLATQTLEPFRSMLNCIVPCYKQQRELKDVCRALYIGYNLIGQSVAKNEPKHQHQPPVEVQDVQKQDSVGKNQSIGANIVPAVANIQAANEASKEKTAIPLSKDAEVKKPVPENPNSGGAAAAKKPDGTEVGTVSKSKEKPEKEPAPVAPVKQPQEAPHPERNEGDLEQQQGGLLDGIGGDVAPFDDEPKQALDPDGKGAPTQPAYDNSEESEAIGSPEDGNDDDSDVNGFQQSGKAEAVEKQPKLSHTDDFPNDQAKASDDIVRGTDPFYEQKDSNFFSYFLFAMFSCAVLYVAYHNKSKLLALVVEGRRTSSGRGGFSKGRKHTAAYRPAVGVVEEAEDWEDTEEEDDGDSGEDSGADTVFVREPVA